MLEPKPESPVAAAIRRLIVNDARSQYWVAHWSGANQGQISRFLSGRGSLNIEDANAILGLWGHRLSILTKQGLIEAKKREKAASG